MEKQWFVGIDISKKTLDCRIYFSDNFRPENYLQVTNCKSGFKTLLKWFKTRKMQLSEIAVCMEHTGSYGLDISLFLEESGVDYLMVPGLQIKRSLGLARGKSDKVDAARIARYCYQRRDELVYSKSKSEALLCIQSLVAERRHQVKRQVQAKTYLTEHKGQADNRSKLRYKQEQEQAGRFIREIESEILEVIASDSDLQKNYDLLVSITGIAFVNAVNIILYTNNFTGFANARAYACYIGVAPFAYQSGTSISKRTRVSKLANRRLKADLSQAAVSAIGHDPELRNYYRRKIAQGKDYGKVLNAVKFKLVERMFAVVNRGSRYVKLGSYAA